MTSFPISDDIAEQLTDAVFGPGSRRHHDRVEIVHMALTQVAPDLYRAWTPNPVPLPASIDTEA